MVRMAIIKKTTKDTALGNIPSVLLTCCKQNKSFLLLWKTTTTTTNNKC